MVARLTGGQEVVSSSLATRTNRTHRGEGSPAQYPCAGELSFFASPPEGGRREGAKPGCAAPPPERSGPEGAGGDKRPRAFLSRLLDLLCPPKCIFCGKLLGDGEREVCAACRASLPWVDVPPLRVKGADRCAAALWYRGRVRESLHRYKFEGRDFYAPAYGRLLAQCVRDRLGTQFDLICWAPLSRKRRRQRGYDQAELLARALAAELDRPAAPLLRKVRDTAAQSSLEDDGARAANAAGAYALADGAQARGKRVLLVDDIVTTGSTLASCARVLRDAGAEQVWAAALARARR